MYSLSTLLKIRRVRYLTALAISLMLFTTLGIASNTSNRVEVIELKHRSADEVLPLVRSLLEGEGTASSYGFKLIVKASPSQILEVKNTLRQLDIPAENLLIEVKQNGRHRSRNTEWGVDSRTERDNISVTTGSANRSKSGGRIVIDGSSGQIGLNIDDRASRGQENISHRVRVVDGREALIQLGRSVPIRSQDIRINNSASQSRIIVSDNTTYKDVNKGFYVIPRIRGEQVELQIRIQNDSVTMDGSDQIDTNRTATFVSGNLGQWINLSGVTSSEQQNSRDLAGQKSATMSNIGNVSVRVTRIDR